MLENKCQKCGEPNFNFVRNDEIFGKTFFCLHFKFAAETLLTEDEYIST